MTTLYLVRHGQTFDNVAQIMQGQTHGRLTPDGIRQASELAAELSVTHFDAVVASDLRRAVETAEILAAPHGLAVATTALLRERDWGGFTGRFIPDLKDQPWPNDVETLQHLKARAGEFLTFIGNSYPDKTVLAVGHGIINRAVQAVHFGKEMGEIKLMQNIDVRILHLSANRQS